MTDTRWGWEVRAYPRDDPDFLAAAQAAVASSWETIHHAERLVDDVRAKLRIGYPSCELRLQEDLAQLGSGVAVIYVFRDGRAA